MFKRHVYTCPDVIYLRNRQKRIAMANFGLMLIFWGGLYIYGKAVENDIDKSLEELHTEN